MNLLEKAYVLIHFPLIIFFYHELSMRNQVLGQFLVTIGVVCLILSIASLGFIMERRWFAPFLELARCLFFFAAEQSIWPVVDSIELFDLHRVLLIRVIRIAFLVSSVGCAGLSLTRLTSILKQRMEKKTQ